MSTASTCELPGGHISRHGGRRAQGRPADDGLRPHCCAKFIAPTCGHMHPEGSCRRTATSTWPSMPTRSRRSARTHLTSTRPRARLLIRLTSTDLPSDQFSVFLLQKGVMMTNEPPQGCAAPQLPRLLRMIRPDRERLPERETEQCAMCGWTPIRPRRHATSSSRPSGHPERSCCRTATYLLGLRCPPSRRSARKHIQPQLSSSPTFPCFSCRTAS